MDIRNRRALKAAASDALCNTPNQKRLVLIWAGVGTVLPLLISVLSYLLDYRIEDTGGLSGIGLRSILSTAQSVLSTSSSILFPFWSFGYIAVTLRFARRETATDSSLLDGFRRFRPVFRLLLLEFLIYAAIGFLCFQIVSTVLSFTPLAAPVYAVLEGSQDMLLSGVIDDRTLQAVTEAIMPILIIIGIVCVIVMIPVSYRLRLAPLCIMDIPGCRARQAIRMSFRLMRRNSMALFRLDLSFWWFYLMKLLVSFLCYGEVFLPMLGITLPFSYEVSFFTFYIASLLVQFCLLYACSNKIQTTYALFYDALRTPPKEQASIIV